MQYFRLASALGASHAIAFSQAMMISSQSLGGTTANSI
jgi:hypothetical protein